MKLKRAAGALRGGLRERLRGPRFRLQNWNKAPFECPICGYRGPFRDLDLATGVRAHAACARCGSLERHRLQYLVMQKLWQEREPSKLRMLHVAPESFMREIFCEAYGGYETADLNMEGVDHRVDLQDLPFPDASYDLVYASHVLEHIPDDSRAITEIRRILKPGGMSVLPVPIVAAETIEYPEPNPHETYHVRAPGLDYFERFEPHFSRVEKYGSESLPERFQLFTYEDRSAWPTPECPLRPSMPGERHVDIVPVCYA